MSNSLKDINPMVWSQFQMWFTAVFTTAAGVTFVVGFFHHIGFSEFHIAIYGSSIGFAGFVCVIGTWIAQRRGRYKRTVMFFLTTASLFCLGGSLTGAFGGPGKMIPVIVLALMALYQLSVYMASPVILPWLNIVIGNKEWPKYYSTRLIVCDLSVMVTSLLVGTYLGKAPVTNKFVLVFTIAGVCGLIGVLFLRPTPAPAIAEKFTDIKAYLKIIINAFRRREIRGIFVVAFIKHFAYGFILPFQPLFLLEDLKLNYTQISYLLCLGTVFSILFYKTWAHINRRIGYYPSLKWNMVLSVFEPFLWVFARAKNPVPVFLSYALFGFSGFQGAVNAGYWPSLLGTFFIDSEEHQKPVNISMYYLVSGTANIIAPLISGIIVQNSVSFSFQAAGRLFISLDSYRFIFIISGLLLIAAAVYAVVSKGLKTVNDYKEET